MTEKKTKRKTKCRTTNNGNLLIKIHLFKLTMVWYFLYNFFFFFKRKSAGYCDRERAYLINYNLLNTRQIQLIQMQYKRI